MVSLALKNRRQVHLRPRAADQPDLDETSVHGEAVDVPQQVVAADDVEDDVDTAAIRQLADRGHEVCRPVVDGGGCTKTFARPAFFI